MAGCLPQRRHHPLLLHSCDTFLHIPSTLHYITDSTFYPHPTLTSDDPYHRSNLRLVFCATLFYEFIGASQRRLVLPLAPYGRYCWFSPRFSPRLAAAPLLVHLF